MATLTRRRKAEADGAGELAAAGEVERARADLEELDARHERERAEAVAVLEEARGRQAAAARERLAEVAAAWEERAAGLAAELRATPKDELEERTITLRAPFMPATYERAIRPIRQRLQREHRHALEVAGRLRSQAGNGDLAAERLAELVEAAAWPDDGDDETEEG